MTPNQVFISYGRADDELFVSRLRSDLDAAGIAVWWDREAMESRGLTFLQEIKDAIAAPGLDRVVLIAGTHALASRYVEDEWRWALEQCKVVVPVLRDGDHGVLPKELALFDAVDARETRPYADARDDIVRQLSSPAPIATPAGVPPPIANFVGRPALSSGIVDALLRDVTTPTLVESNDRVILLAGMGGVGKSVVAGAVARACPVRRSFHAGVVWLSLGRRPDISSAIVGLAEALGVDEAARAANPDATLALLQKALASRRLLIVVDDVWDVHDVQSFATVIGPGGRLLLTSRDRALGRALGAQVVDVDIFTRADATALLAAWMGVSVRQLPAVAADVIDECGLLPLALAVVGATARGKPDRLAIALARLRGADLDRLQHAFPHYPHPSLFASIEIGVEALADDALGRALDGAARYRELGILVGAGPVPVTAVLLLWEGAGVDELDAHDLLELLADRSLLRIDNGWIALHDLQWDYVNHAAGDGRGLHHRLVAAYRERCPNGWASGPDDGYFFQRMPVHLVRVKGQPALTGLLTDPAWLAAKLSATSVNDCAEDSALSVDPGIRLLGVTLRQADDMLSPHPDQLATQLCARLTGEESSSLTKLVSVTGRRAGGDVWLRPLRASLGPSGGPLIRRLPGGPTGHAGTVRSLAISADGQTMASAGNSTNDQTIGVWDRGRGRLRWVLADAAEAGGWTAMTLSADGHRLLSGHRETVILWDLVSGLRTGEAALDGGIRALKWLGGGSRLVAATIAGTVWRFGADGEEPVAVTRLGQPVDALAVSPRGRRVVVKAGPGVAVLDPTSGAVERDWEWPDTCLASSRPWDVPLAVDDDGTTVWVGGTAVTFGPEGAKPAATVPPGEEVVVISAAADLMLTTRSVDADGCNAPFVLSVRRLRSGDAIGTLPLLWRETSAGVLADDGSVAVTADFEHDIRLWDLAKVASWPGRARERLIGFDRTGRWAVIEAEGTMVAIDTSSGQTSSDVPEVAVPPRTPPSPPDGARIKRVVKRAAMKRQAAPPRAQPPARTGGWRISTDEYDVLLWAPHDDRVVARFSVDAPIDTLTMSPDGLSIACQDRVERVHLLRIADSP